MSTPLNPSWSEEAVAILVAGHEAKKSARDIAAELTASGHIATRNSVLGRIYRMGLSTPKPREPKPAPIDGVLFGETTIRQCMFIKQDDFRTSPIVCCGKKTASPGEPWCNEHRAIAFRPKEEEQKPQPDPQPQRIGTELFGRPAA